MENLTTQQRIGKKIKYIRKQRGMSQKELADACGYSNTTICYIERGGDYKISTLEKIEEVLRCKLILLLEEDMK